MAANRDVLIINGHDYTKYVKRKVKWTRNDVDSEKSVRVKAGATMRRDKLGTKRKLTFEMLPMPVEVCRQLDSDIDASTYKATFRDLHGVQTLEFYSSSLSADLIEIRENGDEVWSGVTFDAIEV